VYFAYIAQINWLKIDFQKMNEKKIFVDPSYMIEKILVLIWTILSKRRK